jgi:hypothetical protein
MRLAHGIRRLLGIADEVERDSRAVGAEVPDIMLYATNAPQGRSAPRCHDLVRARPLDRTDRQAPMSARLCLGAKGELSEGAYGLKPR